MNGFRRRSRRLRKNPVLAFLVDFVAIVGVALLLSVLIKAFLIRSFFIPSGSMMDTLQINDRIIVNVLVPEVLPVQRGDVVVFQDPGGWLGVANSIEKPAIEELGDFVLGTFGVTAPDSAEHLVKRVIGVGGDVITCCDADGRLLLNGVAIDESYIRDGANPSDIEFSITVPEGYLWVMGDNRGNSTDSRFHQDLPSQGFVSLDVVVGRAMLVSWPVANWSYLDNYSSTFDVLPKP
ncbi:MAG: signal peptidase I [Aquiluna sp.]|jgi:signal peptidase I